MLKLAEAFIFNLMYISPEQDQKIRHTLRECGQQAYKLAAEPFEVSEKGPNDYVTSIDQYLDRQLSAAFSALFPEDGTITEENVASTAAYRANYQRLWCIDPLDGTEGFIQGKQHYASMIGLLREGEPVAGWIYAPAFDQMYFGGKDWGLFQTTGAQAPQPMALCKPPAPTAEKCKIILGDTDQKNYARAIAQSIPGAEFYSLGSFGLKVMEILEGRAGLYLYFNGRVKVWDTVGPVALALAGGLICCDLQGQALRWTPDAIEPETLAHTQSIAIGWPEYIEPLLGKVQQAVAGL
ncbi:inositol monophosphatase family protein [Microcoleus sp. Pol11C3]|uniref:inositol monophosphatase family protein n=1 Tax=Microcoleus sp. Pol11C3 TaxID=3055390 RepID=UPI002FD174E5